MKKVLGALLLIVLVGAAAAWYFVTYRLDSTIESRIERAGTEALGNAVTVGGVHTDIRNGALTIDRLVIANPPGFSNPHAASFSAIEAAVDYDGFDIKRVVIDKPEFVIEENEGRINFQEMLAALEQAEVPGDGEQAEGNEPILVIRHFRINEARAAFESKSYDRYTDLGVDAIELYDLRGTPSQIATVIAREVIGELSEEAGTELLKEEARKTGRDLGKKLGGSLGSIFGSDENEEEEEN